MEIKNLLSLLFSILHLLISFSLLRSKDAEFGQVKEDL